MVFAEQGRYVADERDDPSGAEGIPAISPNDATLNKRSNLTVQLSVNDGHPGRRSAYVAAHSGRDTVLLTLRGGGMR